MENKNNYQLHMIDQLFLHNAWENKPCLSETVKWGLRFWINR